MRSEYVDMSNDKPGEIPGRRKPKVSWAMLVIPGLVGTYAEADGRRRWPKEVNIPRLPNLKLEGRILNEDKLIEL